MNFKKALVTGAATASLLLNTLTPALAATTIEISGNTNEGDNNAAVVTSQTTSVTQSNNAHVTNNVRAVANTGDNSANRNAGGDVTVDTGNATSTTTVENDLNHNTADVNNCGGCGFGDLDVKVSGNTNEGNNNVTVDSPKNTNTNQTVVTQTNRANVDNHVFSLAETGDNQANRNAGGDVTISTGNAKTDTTVSTVANSNMATIGGGNGGQVSAVISGNTNKGDNKVDLDLAALTWITQDNSAWVHNDVKSFAKTGDNKANRNAGSGMTGDSVTIDTGNATDTTVVTNALNANSARIMGNGSGASIQALIVGNTNGDTRNHGDNTILLDLDATTGVNQNNRANVDNDVFSLAETGDNRANRNASGDVMIDTGNATVDVTVDNMLNFNSADVSCDCVLGDLTAKIAGNTNDDNTIRATLSDGLYVDQANCECQTENDVNNDVNAVATTGDNNAKSNAGTYQGDPSVYTGDATVNEDVTNSGNANVYGSSNVELPWTDGTSVNVNISFDLGDFLNWLMGQLS